MTQGAYPGRRPAGVTLLVVLIIIQGTLEIIGGVLVILFRNNHDLLNEVRKQGDFESSDQTTSRALLVYGIVAVVIGLIYFLVAKGLSNGNGFARFLVALVSVLSLAGGVYLAIAKHGTLRVQGIVYAVVALIILLLLYSRRANEFFRTH